MDKNEYLISRIGKIHIGMYCRDIRYVYTRKIKLIKLCHHNSMFLGLVSIGGITMKVIDLKRRIGMESEQSSDELTLISFKTHASETIAVVVDEIIGIQRVTNECIEKNSYLLSHRMKNIDLLFPTIAKIEPGFLVHLLDSTYLEKTEPVVNQSDALELF